MKGTILLGQVFGIRLESGSGHSCRVCVEYDQGDHVCVGRERTMKQNSCLILWITPRTAESRELVKKWMNSCLDASRMQIGDRVNVFALQHTSKEWIPQWVFTGSLSVRNCEGKGLNYYIPRPECDLIYKDAKDFMGDFLAPLEDFEAFGELPGQGHHRHDGCWRHIPLDHLRHALRAQFIALAMHAISYHCLAFPVMHFHCLA